MLNTIAHKYDVFISYSHDDMKKVHGWLLPELEAAGVQVCIDFRDFEPGAPSITEMERAVLQSRKTILVLTPSYLNSEWGEFENIMAQTLDPAARSRRLLPVILKRCKNLPLRLQGLTYLDFTNRAQLNFQFSRLLKALGSIPASATPYSANQVVLANTLQRVSIPSNALGEHITTITLIIEGNMHYFREPERELFVTELARILNISKDQIRLLQVVSGSIRIIVEIPLDAAERLISMHIADDSTLQTLKIKKIELQEVNRPVRSILFLTSNPTPGARSKLSEEIQQIGSKVQVADYPNRVILHQRQFLRPEDLAVAIIAINPDIIHFSSSIEGYLGFEDKSGEIHPIPSYTLEALFERMPHQLQCVVLQNCYSESQARAIAHHVKYVIGLKVGTNERAAIAFATNFYQAIGMGLTIEHAYRIAHTTLILEGFSDDLIPVLLEQE